MTPEDWKTVRQVFEQCVGHKTSEQQAIIEKVCGNNPLIRAEIQKLLDGNENVDSSGFLDWPDTFPSAQVAANLKRYESIGPYRLIEEIGEGGMGTVWLAEQTQPVKRRVAIKLVKSQLTGREEIARFEAERQALALMDHPNIAKVFDAGTTEDGVPYYVMEYITGVSVTEYCDNNRLSIRDRLQIFIPICRAVQHAHQKGVIHRDLKPSNILVADAEGFPVPKVIDFGLAKSIDHHRLLTDKTLFTEIGKVVGTLQYMSPEQAALTSNDIDNRTDIYSLGIILYELLSGMTPLDRKTIKDKAILKVLDLIRDGETLRPSIRLSSNNKEAATISQHRKIETLKLQNILRGELDWVVMKALEKDRSRRYETASAFAEDIHRFLINEPVIARPPSRLYRMSKFVHRNRLLVSSASVMALLAGAGVVSLWFAYGESLRAEKLAKENETQAVNYAKQLGELSELNNSMADQFSGSHTIDPSRLGEQSNDILIRSRNASASLMVRLGLYMRKQGAERSESLKWFQGAVDAFELLEKEKELEPVSVLAYGTALDNLALELRDAGDRESAIRHLKKEIEIFQKTLDLGDCDQDYIRGELARAYQSLGIIEDSILNNDRAIEILKQIENPTMGNDKTLGICYANRAQDTDDMKAAEADLLNAIELFEKHEFDFELRSAYDDMCTVQNRLGNDEQEKQYRDKGIAVAKKMLANSPDSVVLLEKAAQTSFNAGLNLHRKGEVEEALKLYDEAVPKLRKIAEKKPSIKSTLLYYQTFWHRAEAYIPMGRIEEAIVELDEAIAAVAGSKNPSHLKVLPFLEVKRIRCQGETDPIKAANDLDYRLRDGEHKSDVLLLITSIYSVAGGAEEDEEKKKQWLDKAMQTIEIARATDMLTPVFIEQLKTDADFEALRPFEPFKKAFPSE